MSTGFQERPQAHLSLLKETARIFCKGKHAIAVHVGHGVWRCMNCDERVKIVA